MNAITINNRTFNFSMTEQRKARDAYDRYLKSTACSLYDVYDSYSDAKAQAYDHCRQLMKDLNGHDFRIVSYNIMQFTAGFRFEHECKEWFCYITRDYNRVCLI